MENRVCRRVLSGLAGTLVLAAAMSCSFVPSAPIDDVYEPNNVLGSAADISPMRGKIISLTSSDEDWYAVTLPVGETHVTVDVLFNYDTTDIDVGLYDASAALLFLSATTKNNEHLDCVVAAVGTYYIRVYVASGIYRTTSYTLLWDCSPP